MSTQQIAPTDRNTVSASELVRQFGLWQEQAAREPIFVMHRGRARLVLTSVDLMDRLCAPGTSASTASTEHTLLLDMMREPVIRLDRNLRVAGINSAAAAWLGRVEADVAGTTLSDMMGNAIGGYCDSLVRRACRLASIETAELPLGPHHHMMVTIAPTSPGALLVGVERTADDEPNSAESVQQALVAAMAATDVAHCRINLRGYIEAAEAGLERISGLAPDLLETARFVTLFALGSRVAIGDALDQVLRHGEMQTVDALLHRNRADDLPVTIGLAAVRPRVAIEAAVAVIRARVG